MIADEVLTDAMANAAESRRILFLTPSLKSTPQIVERAVQVSVNALIRGGKERSLAAKIFQPGLCPWLITVTGGKGWVFFFPLTDLDPSEEVGNPDLVYFPDEEGAYFSMDYRSWVTQKTRQNASMWSSVLEGQIMFVFGRFPYLVCLHYVPPALQIDRVYEVGKNHMITFTVPLEWKLRRRKF